MQPTPNPQRLITRDFLALNAIVFLTYCNVAVFFEFHHYLGTLPINEEWFGLLIALFSVTVLAIRPIISPFLHPDNAKRWIAISCVWVIVSLLLYNVAHDFLSMTIVRLLHGAAYVVMATAVVSKLVGGIPRDKSAQAFGLISVITLLPYAVVPPILEPLTRWAGGFENVLNLSCVVMALSFPLLSMIETGPAEVGGPSHEVIGWHDATENLKDPRILSLMLLSLVVWTWYTPVFYFIKGQGDQIGVPNPGWFFTLSTFAEIAVRLLAGALFDKLNKSKVLLGSLLWLGFSNLIMAHLCGPVMFYTMGIVLGLGWGVAMPVLSGLIFDVSVPRFRALNTNFAMEMFQCGFFVGPLVGASILVHSGYGTLFYACGGLLFAGLATAPVLCRKSGITPETPNEEEIWKQKKAKNR